MILRDGEWLSDDERAVEAGMFGQMAHHKMPPTSRETRALDIVGGELLGERLVYLPQSFETLEDFTVAGRVDTAPRDDV